MARGAWLWLPIYAPSIAADLFAAFLFARTLAGSQIPLIERIVRLLHSPEERLDPGIPRYARRLTAIWAALFCLLAGVSLALALLAVPHGILSLLGIRPPVSVPQSAWSVFANFLEYVIIAVFFVGEYAYRRRHFPQQPYRSVFDFLRRVVLVTPRALSWPSRPALLQKGQA